MEPKQIRKAGDGWSGTRCECTSDACGKAEGYQRHPSGRCVRDAVIHVDGKAYCEPCALEGGAA